MSRKRGSTTARQANLPINLAKMEMFRTHPYPAGSVDISLLDMVDFDQRLSSLGLQLGESERRTSLGE